MTFDPSVLRKIIEGGGIPFKEGSVSFIFNCPRCLKTRKLYIRKRDGRFVCWSCREKDNFQGKPEFALSELYCKTVEEVREELYGKNTKILSSSMNLDFKNPYENNLDEDFGFEDIYLNEIYFPPDFVDSENLLFSKGRNYLINKRGLQDIHIREYKIMFHPTWRTIVFPVFIGEKLVGWQERSIVNNFKYTLKGFKKEQVLMFQNRLINSKHAVLCEGPIDSIKAHLCGGNVASMGKGVSKFQLDIIKNNVKKLYLALDPDASTEIDRICRSIYDDIEIYLLFPPKNRKDLGESTFEEVFEQFKMAKKYCGQMQFYIKNPWK